jgi:hypothetical protein
VLGLASRRLAPLGQRLVVWRNGYPGFTQDVERVF